MLQGIKLSKENNQIARSRMAMNHFGNAQLLSKDVITFEGDNFSKAIGKTIYLQGSPQTISVLPEGVYSLIDNTVFSVDAQGKLSKITTKGTGDKATSDPALQKQGWARIGTQLSSQKERAIDRNVVKDDGSPRSTQLQRHREQILFRFGSSTVYGGQKITFPNATPTVGTSALSEGNVLADGIYSLITKPVGSLTVKNGLISNWSPVTVVQKPAEEKLHNVAFSLFDDPSDAARVSYFSQVDDLELPITTKNGLKADYKKRVSLHIAKHTKI